MATAPATANPAKPMHTQRSTRPAPRAGALRSWLADGIVIPCSLLGRAASSALPADGLLHVAAASPG